MFLIDISITAFLKIFPKTNTTPEYPIPQGLHVNNRGMHIPRYKDHYAPKSPGRGGKKGAIIHPLWGWLWGRVPLYPGMCIPGLVTFNPYGIKEILTKGRRKALFIYAVSNYSLYLQYRIILHF